MTNLMDGKNLQLVGPRIFSRPPSSRAGKAFMPSSADGTKKEQIVGFGKLKSCKVHSKLVIISSLFIRRLLGDCFHQRETEILMSPASCCSLALSGLLH